MREPHHVVLVERARARGMTVDEDITDISLAVIRHGDRVAHVIDGQTLPGLSHVAVQICDRKDLCKRHLESLGIPTPRGIRFADATEPRMTDALRGGGRWCLKPDRGMHGEGVALGLRTLAEVEHHIATFSAPMWVLEEQVEGADLRLHGIGERLVAACVRRPADVIGDGERTLAELIEAREVEVARHNPLNRLRLDATTAALLAEQQITASDVPAAGRRIALQQIANVDAGGTPVDTDVHPRYHDWIRQIARSLALPVCAIDVMTADPVADPRAGDRCLEINASPQWLHHTFSEGRTHDIAGLMLDALFG